MSIYCDAGADMMESGVTEAVHFSQNAYNANAWSVKPFVVLTDTMYNTPCRAPGSTQVYDFKKDEVDDRYQEKFEINLKLKLNKFENFFHYRLTMLWKTSWNN